MVPNHLRIVCLIALLILTSTAGTRAGGVWPSMFGMESPLELPGVVQSVSPGPGIIAGAAPGAVVLQAPRELFSRSP